MHPPISSSSKQTVLVAMLYVAGLTLFRLFFCTHLQLIPDEAYYWEWSRHLDFCYRDKGPAVAWTIAAGTALMGDTVFGVRWLGVLLAAGTGWQLFVLARRLFDDSVALAALLIASVIPLLAIGSIIMTIDSLSVFFWVLGANLAWTAVQTNRKRDWALFGLAVGCGFLAKFTNVLQLCSIFLFLLWMPSKRRLILSAGPILMLAVFALCTTPILYWNMVHHWPNARALSSRSSLDVGFHIHPLQTLKFLEEQALAISPLIFVGMLAGVIGLWLHRRDEDRIKFLLCDFFSIYGCFTLFSLNASGNANWTAPALMSGTILMVVFWKECLARSRGWRIPVGFALALAVTETVILHDTSWLHLDPRKDPLQRAKGWDDLATHVEKWKQQYSSDFIIANHYSVASILAFYLPNHPTTYTPTSKTVDNQYDLWPGYHAGPDSSALFVSNEENQNPVPLILQQEFKHVVRLERFYTVYDGRQVRQFQIFLCSNREPVP
ncbi:MAG: glycosyltransferase family 39 protein [Methylacidiphilales bacterium]|nr:glycosyltransferase family 39 protein [Candidatus Methylacidiphilales bacterium]